MRPAPPPGCVSSHCPTWTEFQKEYIPVVAPPGPRPSECPTCESPSVDVQSPHGIPAARPPSRSVPVRMSCSFGLGEPAHCPFTFSPFSGKNSSASPARACSAGLSAASYRSRCDQRRWSLGSPRSSTRARCARPPAPTASASVWQRMSAPLKPPRFAVMLVELVTKKFISQVACATPSRWALRPIATLRTVTLVAGRPRGSHSRRP